MDQENVVANLPEIPESRELQEHLRARQDASRESSAIQEVVSRLEQVAKFLGRETPEKDRRLRWYLEDLDREAVRTLPTRLNALQDALKREDAARIAVDESGILRDLQSLLKDVPE